MLEKLRMRRKRRSNSRSLYLSILLICTADASGSFGSRSAIRTPLVGFDSPIDTIRGGSDPFSEPPGQYYGDGGLPPTDRETVQERVENWRNQQREYSPEAINSPRDEQGRMKLLTSVGKGSRALIFFVLMWRNVHLYEVADKAMKGVGRNLIVTPLVILFIGNMAGAVASITSPSQSAKKRLKAILNLDKLMEVILVFWYFLRLTVIPNKYAPREIYIASILHSVFFILQCQAFTKLTWDEKLAPSVSSYTYEQSRYGGQRTQPQDPWRESPPSQQLGPDPYDQSNYN